MADNITPQDRAARSTERELRSQRRERSRATVHPPSTTSLPATTPLPATDTMADQDALIEELRRQIADLRAAVASSTAATTAAPPTTATTVAPSTYRDKVRDPEPWDGTKSPDHYLAWKRAILYKLRRDAPSFPTDCDKAEYIVSRLAERPVLAFTNAYDNDNAFTMTEKQVWGALDRLYGLADHRATAIAKLATITPGSRPNFKEFVTEYQVLARQAGWDDTLSMQMLVPKLSGSMRILAMGLLHEDFETLVSRLLRATEVANPTPLTAASTPSSTSSRPRAEPPRTTRPTPSSSSSRRPSADTSERVLAPPRIKRESPTPMGRTSKPPPGMGCHNCGEASHWKDQCPHPPRQYSAASMDQVPEDFEVVGHVEEATARSSFEDDNSQESGNE